MAKVGKKPLRKPSETQWTRLVGRNVRRIRVARSLSQEQLSELMKANGCGMHPGSICRLETGVTHLNNRSGQGITVDQMIALVLSLNISLYDLIEVDDEMRNNA